MYGKWYWLQRVAWLSEINSRVRSEGGTDDVRKLVNGEMAVKISFSPRT